MRHNIFYLVFFFALLFSFRAGAQDQPVQANMQSITQMEDSLVNLADSMLHGFIPEDRLDFGFKFARTLKKTLEMPGASGYSFDSLAKVIHILVPKDNSFKLFNWLVAPDNGIRRYYGIIQMSDGKLYPLLNYADRISANSITTAILDPKHWYGCAYYKIMKVTGDDKDYYCLFGVNTDGYYSNKKVLDVMTLTDKGPQFGADIFRVPNENGEVLQPQARFILEYKKTAQCNLNYNDERKMILFDHLSSDIYDPARKNTYTPTGQVDGFRWDNGQWVFVPEAIPVLKLKDGEAPIDGVLKK
jgi:hypothetical protein